MELLINGLKLNYEFNIHSSLSETIVFLHGWGGSIASFKFVENYFFNKGFNTLNLDFFGFGKSDEPKKDFTIFDYASGIKALLTELKIENPIIIAHSFGGRVALLLNGKYKVKVKKLILTGCAGIKPKFSFKKYFAIKRYKFIKFLVQYKLLKADLSKYGSQDYKILSDDMKSVFKNVVNTDLKGFLKCIDCPTLLIWGKDDDATPLYMAKKINKGIKDSGLVILDGGHFAYLENMEKFLIICNNFIA